MKNPQSHTQRYVDSFPLIAALVYQGYALNRWASAILAISVIGILSWTSFSIRLNVRAITLAGIVGVLMAFLPNGSSPEIGLFSPILGDVLLNTLVALAVISLTAGERHYANLMAWGVIGLAVNPNQITGAIYPLVLFCAAILLAAGMQSRSLFIESRSRIFFCGFVISVAVLAFGFGGLTKALQLAIQDVIGSYYNSSPGSGMTGIGREMYVGSRGSLNASDEVVLDLSRSVSKLRSRVYDRFDGSRWYTATETRDLNPNLPAEKQGIAIDIFFQNSLLGSVPTPAGTTQVVGAKTVLEGGWIVRADLDPAMVSLIYDPKELMLDEPEPPTWLTEVPDSLAEDLGNFSTQLTSIDQDEFQKAEAIERFFQTNYEYSLETNLTGEKHPIIELLEKPKPAYCVYFASAMALLLRSEGIPARVVSGYVPIEKNQITGRVLVRRRDAHAWVEVWDSMERRYVSFDPTPMESRDRLPGFSNRGNLLSDIYLGIASLIQRTWVQHQNEPLSLLYSFVSSSASWLLIGCLGGYLWVMRYRNGQKKNKRGEESGSRDVRVFAAYQRYLETLNRRGISFGKNQTDEDLIQSLREKGPTEIAGRAELFIEKYRKVRFGDEAFRPELNDLAELRPQSSK